MKHPWLAEWYDVSSNVPGRRYKEPRYEEVGKWADRVEERISAVPTLAQMEKALSMMVEEWQRRFAQRDTAIGQLNSKLDDLRSEVELMRVTRIVPAVKDGFEERLAALEKIHPGAGAPSHEIDTSPKVHDNAIPVESPVIKAARESYENACRESHETLAKMEDEAIARSYTLHRVPVEMDEPEPVGRCSYCGWKGDQDLHGVQTCVQRMVGSAMAVLKNDRESARIFVEQIESEATHRALASAAEMVEKLDVRLSVEGAYMDGTKKVLAEVAKHVRHHRVKP